jgi:serine/threonine-protein kinase
MDPQAFGRYVVVETIGRGAMGEVHKAWDPVLKRHVAVKVLTGQHGLDAEIRRRFEREAQSVAGLNHPNIVTVYELGQTPGADFIAMELLPGGDLKEMIGGPSLRDPEVGLRIVDQVLSGLAYAHAAGVVHRDLKPANIRVLESGQVKVMDFGLARLQGAGAQVTQDGMILGTPNYMSPEQVQGERATAASDVFALGALFYEVLTGHRAFEADSLHAILSCVLADDPPPVRTVVPAVSPAVEDVVHRALCKDPRQRFADAGEMRAALHAAAPELAAGPGGSGRLPRLAEMASAPVLALGEAPTVSTPVAPEIAEAVVRSASESASRQRRTRRLFAAMSALGVVAATAGLWALLARPAPPPAAPGAVAPAAGDPKEYERMLRAQLFDSLVQLARVSLDSKDYDAAVRKAEEALGQDPTSELAQTIRDEARAAAALRLVLQEYGRAIESRDVARLRSLKPNLTSAEERRFVQAVKPQVVRTTVIEVTGGRAVARVERNDTVGGQSRAHRETLHLVRRPDGWTIESIGE